MGEFIGSAVHQSVRFISGNVLTGKQIDHHGYIGYYDNLMTIIPEPERREFLGWMKPGLNKRSLSKTFFSSFLGKTRTYKQMASLNGGKRAFVATGIYEDVLPMKIYPVFLIKSILAQDFEEMEDLGIYEVIEEDLAICEYIDPSKNEFQEILRNGLDLLYKEG